MDYNKLSIRFSNYGWNLTQDPQALDFGQYTKLTNAASTHEGQLTSRKGMDILNDTGVGIDVIGDAIRGVRRLNDSIIGKSTYVVRAGTHLYVTTDVDDDTPTTTPLFMFSNIISSGFNQSFGSILPHRTGLSNQVWAYIGDSNVSKKIAINQAGTGIDVYGIGITRPQAAAPTLDFGSPGELTGGDTYQYRYTFYDSRTGVESLYNLNEADSITLGEFATLITVQINAETPDTAVTHIRIYRSSTSSAAWLQVTEVALPADFSTNGYLFTDTASDLSIANANVLNELSDKPFTTVQSNGAEQAGTPLPYWFGPNQGYILAVGDINNPGILYWTDKFNPDTQDPANNVEVTSPADPLQNGVIYDGQAYVFSKDKAFRMTLTDDGFVPFEIPVGKGLFFPHAICAGPEIYFMANDGIYATSGGPARLLTDDSLRPLFHGETVNGYSPIDFDGANAFAFMEFHEREIWFTYRGQDGSVYTIVFDISYRRWRFVQFRTGHECLYSDEQTVNQLIIGTSNGYLFKYAGTQDDNGSDPTIPVTIATQTITLGSPLIHKEFGSLIVDIDPKGSTVTFDIYTDNRNTLVTSVSDSSVSRTRKFIPIDEFAENLIIEFSWSSAADPPILYGYELLYRHDAVQLESWSVTGISHGLEGWQILRSAYITLRSDGTVNLIVTTDGDEQTYTIASTGGQKRKIFVPFNPTKGKVFDYRLEILDATYFRLYNDMCEVHVKPFVTSLGYARANPFQGGEGAETLNAAGRSPAIGQSDQAGLSQVPNQGFVPSTPL